LKFKNAKKSSAASFYYLTKLHALLSNIRLEISELKLVYFIEYSAHFFYIENDAEKFPARYTWKVARKGFKISFMMHKIAMINSFEIIFEK
jgi:hypothetical protein